MQRLNGKRALITGASSGIGAAFACILAENGVDLVITARRHGRLNTLAEELSLKHGVCVESIPLDLALPRSAGNLYEQATLDQPIQLLINNAGFGNYGDFVEHELDRLAAMVQLNTLSLLELTHLAARDMLKQQTATFILNVASTTAFQPVPGLAAYGATKSFVRDLSEALAHELHNTQLGVTCLCPGPTVSEFADVAGQEVSGMARSSMMSARKVAQIGLEAMLERKKTVVSGAMNKAQAALTSYLPRGIAAQLLGAVLKKTVGKKDPVKPE